MTTPQIPFRRKAVDPLYCIKAGWELVKGQYWLFLGMCFVGFIIGQAVPLGILLGPMMCGLYVAFFKRMRGAPVEFGDLFKGFDYFGPSVIATLLHIIPILAIVLPSIFLFYASLIVSIAAQGSEPNPAAPLVFLGMFGLVMVVIMLVSVILSIGFMFSYALIVDRKMPGLAAVKLSFKAAMANFWSLLGLAIIQFVMGLVGFLFLYVGMFFVLPITYASIAVAYERIFGLYNPGEAESNLPPPPPSFI
jgi:uncharacterized membrane protein